MNSTVNIDNKNKDILLFGEGSTQGLDDTTLTVEAKYPFNQEKCLYLSLHYNGSNGHLFVSATKIYQFKAKDSEIKYYTLLLGNISKDYAINYKKKIGLKESVKIFSVDFNPVDNNYISDISKYFMKGT